MPAGYKAVVKIDLLRACDWARGCGSEWGFDGARKAAETIAILISCRLRTSFNTGGMHPVFASTPYCTSRLAPQAFVATNQLAN